MKNFKRNIYRLSGAECEFTGVAVEVPTPTTTQSPYSITNNCIAGFTTNDYILSGVPAGATVVVKATFSGYLTRASGSNQANASVGVNGGTSQTSPCIATQGSFNIQDTDTFSAPANGVFTVSAIAQNYSVATGVNLAIELVSVNGVPVGDTAVGCWGNSGGSNGCPA